MKGKWTPHIIAVTALIVFIVLGLACASAPKKSYTLIDGNLVIRNGITDINPSGFRNMQLTSVTLPDSVTTIWGEAFAYNKLTSVTIPNSVTIIVSDAFANNPLTSVIIPDSVKGIGTGAFGSLTPYILAYGVGTYTKQGNQVLHNGQAIQEPAKLIGDSGVEFTKIDGKSPNFQGTAVSPNHVTSSGPLYIAPGIHSVSVKYARISNNIYVTSKGDVTFEHRYLFEGGEYVFTAKPEGNEIVFRIERK